MPRTMDYCGELVELADYLPEHYFANQVNWAERHIPLNPALRPDFNTTPHRERDPLEIEHWWMRPYIITEHYSMIHRDYASYVERMKAYPGMEIMCEGQWERSEEDTRDSWFTHWPSGTRYDVRCLNGGAWDRSSAIGSYASLREAIEVAFDADSKIVDYGKPF